jgi:FkbM family methyltransferase
MPAYADGPGGTRLYVDPSDGRGRALIETRGNIHPPAAIMWRQLLVRSAWDCIIDAGANYGEMLVGTPMPAAARIIALEPNPYIVPLLRRSLAEANLTVEVLEVALAAADGICTFGIDRTWSGTSAVLERSQAEHGPKGAVVTHSTEYRSVASLTLGALFQKLALHECSKVVIKLDIEGLEAGVLRSAERALATVSEYAIMVEAVRLRGDDVDYLLPRFRLQVFDLARERLVDVAPATPLAFRQLLAKPPVYPRDVVLLPLD